MTDITATGAGVSASVIGTATSVVYTAAVVLAGAGVGLADTGTLGLSDHEQAGPGGVGVDLLNGASTGDTLLGFAHANLDPHTQPAVSLVGAVLHNLGLG